MRMTSWTHETRDGGRGGEGTSSTGNFVENMNDGVHASQAVDIAANNVCGAADQIQSMSKSARRSDEWSPT